MCNKHAGEDHQPKTAPVDVCSSVEPESPKDICAGCKINAFHSKIRSQDVYVGQECARTRLLERLDGGAFGEVYLGSKVDTSEHVAVKIEQDGAPQQLLYEGSVYRALAGGPGIPVIHWFGLLGSTHNAMVMELLGPNLYRLFKHCNHQFSLRTVLQLVDQMVTIIQYLHDNNFIHRDLSPNNFTVGIGSSCHRVYLIDFGQAKKISSGPVFVRGRHRFQVTRPLVGTPRFASVHAHKGNECSRRDDLESLAYVWIYFLKGRLPWQGLHSQTPGDKLASILDMKLSISPKDLCHGLHEEFTMYVGFVRRLRQYDMPDYSSIRELFRGLANRQAIAYDGVFDWKHPEEKVDADTPSEQGDFDKLKPQRDVDPTKACTGSASSNDSIVSH